VKQKIKKFPLLFKIIILFLKQEIKYIISIFNFKKKLRDKNLDLIDKKKNFFTKFAFNEKKEKKILITSFLGINDYLKYEYLLGIYLSNIRKESITVLLEKKDSYSKNFFLKKGLNNFIYYRSKPIFLKRVIYFIKSYYIISKIKDINELVKFKYEGIPTGKMIYSHVARFTRTATFDKIEPKFYSTFAIYLHYAQEFKNIIDKNKFRYFVQSEPQFIPPSIFMGYALKKKINMLTRMGTNKIITTRIINNIKNFLETRWKYDKKNFDLIKKKYKSKAIKIGGKIINDRFNGLKDVSNQDISQEAIKIKKSKQVNYFDKYDKKYVCKFFNWQLSRPIGIIMANDLTDGLFNHKWEIYRDNYIWLREVLKFASMNSNINWIVKPHPNDIKNDDAQKVKKIFEKNIHPNHIKFFPENWGRANLHKVSNIIYTNFGSAAYEYAAMGVPAVVSSECNIYGLNIAYETKNSAQLKKIIMRSHKIKRLDKRTIDNAKIFVFLEEVSTKVKIDTATNDNLKEEDVNSTNYWKRYFENYKNTKVYKNKSLEKDEFYRTLKYQVDKKLKHSINLKFI
jgi:hypothetical protein